MRIRRGQDVKAGVGACLVVILLIVLSLSAGCGGGGGGAQVAAPDSSLPAVRIEEVNRFITEGRQVMRIGVARTAGSVYALTDEDVLYWEDLDSTNAPVELDELCIYFAVSPDGEYFACQDYADELLVYSGDLSTVEATIDRDGFSVMPGSLSAGNDKLIALYHNVSSSDGYYSAVRILDFFTGEVKKEFVFDSERVYKIEFSPDGGQFVIDLRTEMNVYDSTTWSPLLQLENQYIQSFAFSNDGDYLFYDAYNDDRIYDTGTWELVTDDFSVSLSDYWTSDTIINYSSTSLVEYSFPGLDLKGTYDFNSRDYRDVVGNPAAEKLLLYSNVRIDLYDVETHSMGANLLKAELLSPNEIAVSRDSHTAYISSSTGEVYKWDYLTSQPEVLFDNRKNLICSGWNSDGSALLCRDPDIFEVSINSGSRTDIAEGGSSLSNTMMQVDPGSTFAVVRKSISSSNPVIVYSLPEWEAVFGVSECFSSTSSTAGLSLSGKYFFCHTGSGEYQVWNTSNWNLERSIRGNSYVEYFTTSPDSRFLVTVDSGDSIVVWDTNSWLSTHLSYNRFLYPFFTSDGRRLLSLYSEYYYDTSSWKISQLESVDDSLKYMDKFQYSYDGEYIIMACTRGSYCDRKLSVIKNPE